MKTYVIVMCIGLLALPQVSKAAVFSLQKSASNETSVDAWAQSWGKYYGNEDDEEEETLPELDAWAQSWGKYYGDTREEETSSDESTHTNSDAVCRDPYVDAWVYRLLCQ